MVLYWIWLTTRQKLFGRHMLKALEYFETPEAVFRADSTEYRLAGLPESSISELSDKSLQQARDIAAKCANENISILTLQDAAYPKRLRNISDPPLVLYYKGKLPVFDDEPVIGVVGSRKSSAYGLSTAKHIGYQVGACGGIVVSGLAAGGDAMAMDGALRAGRPVVGVLGCGIDVIYPRRNRELYAAVQQRGCLLSEFAPGTPPLPQNFPMRNRIISGLSLGVVVVEAPEKSGTLITANLALEQGRDVFVVPGNINVACCAGSNRLLREGAIPIENGWNVMEEYLHLYPDRIRKSMFGVDVLLRWDALRDNAEPRVYQWASYGVADSGAESVTFEKKDVDNSVGNDYIDVQEILADQSADEQVILQLLLDGPCYVDELVGKSSMTAGRILASITLLEVKGYVKRLPGNRYVLASKS